MNSSVITLRLPNRVVKDLELPKHIPTKRILPVLLKILPGIQESANDTSYRLVWEKGSTLYVLRPEDTLADIGIITGCVLRLETDQRPVNNKNSGGTETVTTRLRFESGQIIVLENYGKAELIIGRYDVRTGVSPDIDVSDFPAGSSVSRCHAMLRKQAAQWTLSALAETNETSVGKVQLLPTQPRLLKSGDVVKLGGLTFIFENN